MSLTVEEMVSSCGLGKEGLKGHRHQAEPHGQGGWWLWTNKVVTWNPAGWASLSHFLPVPTVPLSHLQEVRALRWREGSPGSSCALAATSARDPQAPASPCLGLVPTPVTQGARLDLPTQAKGFFRGSASWKTVQDQGPLSWSSVRDLYLH